MPHIECHPLLKIHLHLLYELHKEAESEYGGKAVAKIESRAHTFRELFVDEPAADEYKQICNSLVQLCRVAWYIIHLCKYYPKRAVGGAAQNLGIHKVAQAYEGCNYGGGYGYIVEYPHERQLGLAAV